MHIISSRQQFQGSRAWPGFRSCPILPWKELKWLDYYRGQGEACRHFDISPQTFYRWKRRFDPRNLKSLEDRSRWPQRLRGPTWSSELTQAVLRLRERYPRWGKSLP